MSQPPTTPNGMASPAGAARLAYVNLFARDIVALSGFYAALFGFEEVLAHRSPIYRCLNAGGIELGFNDHKAYALLDLAARQPEPEQLVPVSAYFTIELASVEAIAQTAARATSLGGSLLKPPYATYYNAWQAVLRDPEGNVFRINHRIGPRTPFEQTGLSF